MYKKWTLWATALLLSGCCHTTNTQPQGNTYPKLESHGEMPILAWHSIAADCTTLERFQELKEAGFTHHFSGYPDTTAMAQALDLAQQSGLKVIISCPELESDPENTVRRFMTHPATAGYFMRDEPATPSFPALGEWAHRIQSVDSAHFCYLNLLPTYAPLEALVAESYRDYVHRFDQEVPLQLLSFDHYPIVGDTYRGDWYENLEIFSDEARQAGKPFWAFALATAHTPYPIPTLAMLRFQMYSNLAYGAQGLQYFTYWTPGKNPNWNFHHGPIGLDGKRTDVYDKIQTMNREIQAYSGVFLGAKVLGVHHTGDTLPQGTTPLTTLPAGVQKLETVGAGAVVSELQNDTHRYLVIVNRDFLHSMELHLEVAPDVQRIMKDGSIVPASLYSTTLMVESGDALIYRLQ
ncbi:MAG: hypothetical protein PHV49_02550 [Alistipes sp.]|nr:hypothetical protein [Alistipes sp.]